MPAFAHFVRRLKTEISTLRTRSKLRGSSKDSTGDWELQPYNRPRSAAHPPGLGRRSGPAQAAPPTDTMLLRTQMLVTNDVPTSQQDGQGEGVPPGQQGILKTTDIHQQESRAGDPTIWARSVERLL